MSTIMPQDKASKRQHLRQQTLSCLKESRDFRVT